VKQTEDKTHSQPEQDVTSSSDTSDQPETPTRRQLIERCAKYAIVGAPLLLFASKAHAIHSKP
jgi:hypothetical protein